MYSLIRPFLLALIWLTALAELILTAVRLHHTGHLLGFHEHIVIALLVTSLVTLLWVPYALLTHLGRNRFSRGSVGSGLRHEGTGIVPWLMWLVCTAIYTNRLPAKRFCGVSDQCNLRIAIQALGWIAFGLLTLYKIALLMHASGHGLIGRGSSGRGGAYNDKYGGNGAGAGTYNNNNTVGPGQGVGGRV